MNENATGPQRKRRRPALACEKCRRRKIKCDRNTPCDQCIRSKSHTCTYLSDDSPAPAEKNRRVGIGDMTNSFATSSTMSHEKPSSKSDTPATGAFDAVNDRLLVAGNSIIDPAHTERQGKERTTESVTDLQGSPSASTVQALIDRVHQLEKQLADTTKTPPAEPATVSLPMHNTALPTKGVFSKTRLYGQSHWMNSVEQV